MPTARTKEYLLAHLASDQPPNQALADLIESIFTPGEFFGAGAPAVSVQASLVIDPTGADNSLTFTAVKHGDDGNAISIEYVDPNANDVALSISVYYNAITVSLATGVAGAITTTSDELKTALLAHAEASALVTAANTGADDGSGVLDAASVAYLSGGTGTATGLADVGARYTDTTSGVLYINSGTLAAPVWNAGVGTAATGVTAVESGDAVNHLTTLTLTALPITIGDTAALAGGNLAYTFPADIIAIDHVSLTYGITLTTGTPTTDTPDIGVGTLIGSGANATLDAVDAACENILTGQTAADIAGTALTKSLAVGLVLEAADDHTVYVNWADTFANVDDTAATGDGTLTLAWRKLS